MKQIIISIALICLGCNFIKSDKSNTHTKVLKDNNDSIVNEIKIESNKYEYILKDSLKNCEDDIKKAILKNDFRFIGICGFSLEIPGVEDYFEKYSKTNGIKIIKSTGDSNWDELGLKQEYEKYATEYNALLLKYLKNQNKL